MAKQKQNGETIRPVDPKLLQLSSEELQTKVQQKVDFVDFLLQMGEEPYEIESEVGMLAELIAAGLTKKINGLPLQLSHMSVRALCEYVYLYRWSRRSSLEHMPSTWLKDFIEILTSNEIEPCPGAALSICQFYSLLFHYLHDCGVKVRLEGHLKVLTKFERIQSAGKHEGRMKNEGKRERSFH